MTKQEFISNLQARLSSLPKKEVDDRIDFYGEMIDDLMEDGLSEEEAVLKIGPLDTVASQIIADIPLSKIAKEKIKTRKKLKTWEVILLAAGSPLWVTLLAVAFSVLITLYAVFWSVIAFLWSVFGALAGTTLGGIAAGVIILAINHNIPLGIAFFGASAVCAGVAIFAFFGCLAATKGGALLTKKIALGIKNCFIKKENV